MIVQLRVNGKLLHLQCCILEDQSINLKRRRFGVKYVNTAAICIFVMILLIQLHFKFILE